MAALKTKKDRVADMTVSELRNLVREVVRETLAEYIDQDDESDEELEFTPEVAARLEKFLRDRPQGRPLEEILDEMGITLD
jgi:hypothetical protein